MIFAKKSLGQNFLRSTKALTQIVEAGGIQGGDVVLEIGPGEGVLTARILEKLKEVGGTLIAVEKDDRLIPILQEKFRSAIEDGSFRLIHGDIIEILERKEGVNGQSGAGGSGLSSLYTGGGEGVDNPPLKIIANIPYYITGLIIRHIFEQTVLPTKVVLLVQKEVAERIVARGDNGKQGADQGGKESLLSISIKLYGTPRVVATVPKGAFVPAPTVDSAIICIDTIYRKIPREQEGAFFEFIKAAFSHKRKRMIKNVIDSLQMSEVQPTTATKQKEASEGKQSTWNPHLDAVLLEKLCAQEGLDTNIRAEDITITQYINIFKNI